MENLVFSIKFLAEFVLFMAFWWFIGYLLKFPEKYEKMQNERHQNRTSMK